MAGGPTHDIDPNTIATGSRVEFECQEDGCAHSFWKTWLEADAVNRFGDPRCWKHDPPVYMKLTQVQPSEG